MIENHSTPLFELVLNERDSLGNATGKKKSIKTNDAEKLEEFLNRNSNKKSRKKRKNKNEKSGP